MAEQIQKLQNFFTRDNRATFIRINKYSDPGTLRYSLYKQAEVKYIDRDIFHPDFIAYGKILVNS